MHNYPSDITREQFEIIRPDLEKAKRKTRPRKYDLYDIFCAVLYILRGGIQWRMLPKDLFTITSQCGQKPMKMEFLFWIKF